jgi:hypothetical protein
MNSIVKKILMAAVCAAPLGLAGCEVGYDPGYRHVEYVEEPGYVYAEPPPVVYESYYYTGYYDGPYYRYRDPRGHWIAERREEHDRHIREFHDYRDRHPGDSRAARVQEHQNINNYHNPNWAQATNNRGAMSQAPANRGGQGSGRPDQRSNASHDSHDLHGHDRDDHR